MSLQSPRAYRLLLPLLAILLLAGGLVACGGDDDDSGTSTADKQEYIQQVNAAQQEFTQGVSRLNLSNPSGPEEFKQSLDGLDPLLSGIVKDLEGIEPPEEVKTEHDELISSMQDYQKVLNDNKEGFSSDDQNALRQSAAAIAQASTEFQSEFGRTIDQINTKLRQ